MATTLVTDTELICFDHGIITIIRKIKNQHQRADINSIRKKVIKIPNYHDVSTEFLNTVKSLNSGHLRVLKKFSVIKRCPLLGGSLRNIVTFGTKHFVHYSRHARYLGYPPLGAFTVFELKTFLKNGGIRYKPNRVNPSFTLNDTTIGTPMRDNSYSVTHAETLSTECNLQTVNNSPISSTISETLS